MKKDFEGANAGVRSGRGFRGRGCLFGTAYDPPDKKPSDRQAKMQADANMHDEPPALMVVGKSRMG